jgi:3D (Asp-Asp-Asp) domain-containing protein
MAPALMKALPSRSTNASSTGKTIAVTRGHGDAFSPASQAHSMLASSILSRAWRVPGASITPAHVPPMRGLGQRDSLNTFTQMAQVAISAEPQGQPFGLGVNLLSDRSERLSSLSLERVLDRQTFAPVTTVSIAGSRGGTAEDLALTARRPPVASGLRMVGVHPAATQYLHATTNTHSTASEPGLVKASITQPVTPTSTTVSPATWTAATMPGGNASLYRITGYTWTGGRTATGTYPHWGTVAVDPSVIPLGSTVYIQGLGVFHAEDTGGAVIGQHIDVFVNSVAEAYQLTGYRLVSFIPPSS